MKPGKTFWIVLIVLLVIVAIAYFINQSNKNKIASAIKNTVSTDANAVGRFLGAQMINRTDFTETLNGKAVWLWVGRGQCPSGYVKITSGVNAGWCVLMDYVNRQMPQSNPGVGKKWCCRVVEPNGSCSDWESRDANSPCNQPTA